MKLLGQMISMVNEQTVLSSSHFVTLSLLCFPFHSCHKHNDLYCFTLQVDANVVNGENAGEHAE